MSDSNQNELNLKLKEEIKKLKEDRNYYIYINCWTELYNKYVGLYNTNEKTLVFNHSYNELFYPYGNDDYNFKYEDDDLECLTVKGSWDNWANTYVIHKKRVTDDGTEDGHYEGYVYYIVLDTLILNGTEYQYKIKDGADWIELCIDEHIEEDIYLDDYTEQKMIRNEMGSWNATLVIKDSL